MELKLNLPHPIVVFDTETGGLNPECEISWNLEVAATGKVGDPLHGQIKKLAAPILEIGAILVSPKDLSEIGYFHTYCGPEKDENFDSFMGRCTPMALEVNGFKNKLEVIKSAPPMSEALKSFKNFFPKNGTKLAKFLPCGQNVRFDIDMLNAACRKSGVDLEIKIPPLELITYSQLYFALPDTEIVANYKLTTVAQALGISTKDAHTALADVRMTLACLRKMFARFSSF
jgi:DNA polymerase III subunit epsilon